MTPEKLLVVDDDVDNREMLSTRLTHRGYSVDVAENGFDAMEKIRRAHYDLVLLDHLMPGLSGLDLLALLRATYSQTDLPVIMVTAVDQTETVVEALNRGANDCVMKPVDLPVMAARIHAQLSRSKADRLGRQNERSFSAAIRPAEGSWLFRDPLTGLGNRRMLLDRAANLLDAGIRFSVILLDLDGFKNLNRTFGHAIGDGVLLQTGERLKAFALANGFENTVISRIGGDEFVLLLEDRGVEDAVAVAKALLSDIPAPVSIQGFEIMLSAGIGLVADVLPGATPEEVLRDADIAMFRAKQSGKNRFEIFSPDMRERAKTRMAIVQDLRRAIELHQLAVHYQPKINLRSGAIVGFEALLRWQHPVRGLMPPAEFIPLAEETGLIVALGEWILTQACHQLKTWQTKFPLDPPLSMNVNLSVIQLADVTLVERVRALLEETGIPPKTLKLELTESSLMTDLESARDVLTNLQRLHVGLKLDDFGTGYSSLSYLRTLHFDSLKIDRSFVSRIADDPETHLIVEAIMSLARALDMSVVAEGIETNQQREELIRMGCETGQGFLFSKPVEAALAEQQLAALQRVSAA